MDGREYWRSEFFENPAILRLEGVGGQEGIHGGREESPQEGSGDAGSQVPVATLVERSFWVDTRLNSKDGEIFLNWNSEMRQVQTIKVLRKGLWFHTGNGGGECSTEDNLRIPLIVA